MRTGEYMGERVEKVHGRLLGVVLACSVALLESSWTLLGGLGRLSLALLDPPGRSWEAPGTSWGCPTSIRKSFRKSTNVDPESPPGAPWGPQGCPRSEIEPPGTPRGAKMNLEVVKNTMTAIICLWGRGQNSNACHFEQRGQHNSALNCGRSN